MLSPLIVTLSQVSWPRLVQWRQLRCLFIKIFCTRRLWHQNKLLSLCRLYRFLSGLASTFVVLKWNFKCVNLRWCRFFVLLLPQFFHNFFTCTVLISFLIKYVHFNLHFAFLFSWLFFVNLIFQSLDTIFGKCRRTEQIKGS